MGRAAAESVRTLAWRFAVGGDPFPCDLGDAVARAKFLDRVAIIIAELREMPLLAVDPAAKEITDQMTAIRARSFEDRRDAYLRYRIEHQIGWYSLGSSDHRASMRMWTGVAVGASAFGIIFGLLRFFGFYDHDLLGVASAAAGAAIAWGQMNQHATLASSYAVAARELGVIRERIRDVSEADWHTFVSDSERAISREHTMWLAGHGLAGIRG